MKKRWVAFGRKASILSLLVGVSIVLVSCDAKQKKGTTSTLSKQATASIGSASGSDVTGSAVFVNRAAIQLPSLLRFRTRRRGFTLFISTKAAIVVRPTGSRQADIGIPRTYRTENGEKVNFTLETSAI